jgi:hypothetical protein
MRSKADVARQPYLACGTGAPFAPATVRIEFVDRVLPSCNLVGKPKPTVRADIRTLGEAPVFRHSVQCGSGDKDQRQNLRLVQHVSKPEIIRWAVFRVGFLSFCSGHRELTVFRAVSPRSADP